MLLYWSCFCWHGGSDGSSTEQAQVCLETLPKCRENHGRPKWLHVLYLFFNVLFNLQVNEIRARPSARCRHIGLIFKDFVKVTSWLAERPPQTPAETQWAGLWTAKPQINLSPVDHLSVCMCVFLCTYSNKHSYMCICVCAMCMFSIECMCLHLNLCRCTPTHTRECAKILCEFCKHKNKIQSRLQSHTSYTA